MTPPGANRPGAPGSAIDRMVAGIRRGALYSSRVEEESVRRAIIADLRERSDIMCLSVEDAYQLSSAIRVGVGSTRYQLERWPVLVAYLMNARLP